MCSFETSFKTECTLAIVFGGGDAAWSIMFG